MQFTILVLVGSVLGASARPTEDDVVLPALVDIVELVPDIVEAENAADEQQQLAALVEDTQTTTKHPFSDLIAASKRSKFSGYGRRRRESIQESNNSSAQEEQREGKSAESTPNEFRYGDIRKILALAGAKPQAVVLSGGYSGRRKRSPQEDLEDQIAEETLEVKPVVEVEQPRNFGDVSKILALSGAKPQAVVLSGGYSGRRKRSPQEDLEDQIAEETLEVKPEVEVEQTRNFGDVSKTQDIEVTKPQADDPSNGYSGQRSFGDINKILALAGASRAPIESGSSYGGRRKREAGGEDLHGLVPEVAIHAVKIKSRGNYGNVAQEAVAGAFNGKTVDVSVGYGRKRRSDFVTFGENEERKVKTLKIEQTDFLALKARLEKKKEQADRQKRKFQEGLELSSTV